MKNIDEFTMNFKGQKDLDLQSDAFDTNGTGIDLNRSAFVNKEAILGACAAFNPKLFDAQRLTKVRTHCVITILTVHLL